MKNNLYRNSSLSLSLSRENVLKFLKTSSLVFIAAAFLMSGFFAPNPALADISSLAVISPNGGERLGGGTFSITWTSSGGVLGDLVDITLIDEVLGSSAAIATGVSFDASPYAWVALPSVTNGTNYKIRILKAGTSIVYDTSDAVFTIDNTPPTINSVTTYDTDLNGTVDKATVVFSEPVRDFSFSAGNFTIDGQTGSSIVTGTANDNTFDVLFTTVTGTGVKSIIYTAGGGTDMATPGNALATVTVGATDSAKPVFLSAKTKTTTTIEATFSEDLNGSTVNPTGTDFTVTVPARTISSAHEGLLDDGTVLITLSTPMATDETPTLNLFDSIQDLHDNVAPLASWTASDGTAPVLTSVHIVSNNTNTAFTKVGDTVTVSFTSSEAINTPTVTIAGHPAATVTNPSDHNWTATYVMTSGDTTGLVSFLIAFSDVNSNSGVSVSAVTDASSVTFDKTNPSVAITTPATDSVTTVDNVTGVFVVSDTNNVTCAYTVTVDHTVSAGINCAGDNIAALTDGRRVLALTATDAAGNFTTVNSSFVINLDANLTVGVGKDFTTIQAAVDKATTGNTLTIDAGTYVENVIINGKNLTLTDMGGAVTATSFTLTSTTVSGSTNVTAPTVNVNSGAKIQDGVLLASSVGTVTVTVAAGSYIESLTINKSLTLQGAGSSLVTVTGNQTVAVNNVTLDGFTFSGTVIISDASSIISGGTISNNKITGSGYGIRIGATSGLGIDHITIRDNEITENTNKAILFYNSSDYATHSISYITIDHNQITNNSGSGISTYGTGHNTITNNTVSGNSGNGISIKYDDGDIVTGNIVTGNTAMGINMHQVTNSTVEDNTVSGQVSDGVVTTFWGGSVTAGKGSAIYIHENSHDNTIRLNTLINNKIGVLISRESAGTDPSVNSISNNTITGNAVYGILNALVSPSAPVDATPNWWGEVSGPLQATTNPLGAGNSVSDNVDYSPWCTNIGCSTFGSSDPIDHFNIVPSVGSAVVNVPITLAVTAKDAADITRVNDTSVVSMAADHGASLGTLLLTLASGVGNTTVTNSITGTVNVSGIKVGGSATGVASVEFIGSDLIAPTVLSQTPIDNSGDIAINVSPTITFREAMDANSVNGSTVKLRLYDDDSVISSVVSLNDARTVATIDPISNLLNSTQYYLWVSGATDVAGNPITTYTDKVNQEFTTGAESVTLAVTGVSATQSLATADNTFENGWHWVFSATVPTVETELEMQFSDWTGNAGIISVANNTRFYSVQSDHTNAGNAVTIITANTYAGPIILIGDLDPATPGRQIEITVETKVPVGSAGGSYSASYGINTQ